MTITIIFYKSSSKFYDSVCSQCEWFNNYTQEKSINTLVLDIDEIKENYLKFTMILNTIRNWTKTEYFIDDVETNLSSLDEIIQILECCRDCDKCTIKNEYCYGDAGWGCKQINSITLRKEKYYSYNPSLYWYDFGHFEDEKWIIDDNHILESLQAEITQKHISICKYFDMERIKGVISELPPKIEVVENGDWQFKYRSAPVGMQQTEIIGVQPKEQDHGYSNGFSFNISGLSHDDSDESKEKIEKNVPDVTFSDIGGIDDIVEQVREVIELPIIAPNLFEHYHIKPHRGILLYGPPGCGKTLIAKAIANEINAHFIIVNGPEILNKFVGQSEANLRKIFKEAHDMSPSIIYFDEFDSISAVRDVELNPLQTTVVNQLLTLMDGLNTSSKVCVIASTNRIDIIDEAIKRPGRFDYKIEIQKPSLEGCKSIFNIHTKKMPIDSNFDKVRFVEKYLYGYSGADIAFVSTEAAYNSIRRTVDIDALFSKKENPKITEDNIIVEMDFLNAAKSLKDSISRSESAKYRYRI